MLNQAEMGFWEQEVSEIDELKRRGNGEDVVAIQDREGFGVNRMARLQQRKCDFVELVWIRDSVFNPRLPRDIRWPGHEECLVFGV